MAAAGKSAGFFGSVISGIFTWYHSREKWRTRKFHRRILLSLNTLQNGSLRFRTLFEKDIEQVLLNNDHGVSIVMSSLKQATEENPFIPLPDRERWFILNPILNIISEQYSYGFVAKDMGIKTKSCWFVFGLTFEKEVRFQKMRVMMIQESVLKEIKDMKTPKFEHPAHCQRWSTLKQMSKLYEEQLRGGPMWLMRIEICCPEDQIPPTVTTFDTPVNK